MASNELRSRSNWQTISGAKALKTEDIFTSALQMALDAVYPSTFFIDKHPEEFGNIYSSVQLDSNILSQIYNVDMLDSNGNAKYSWGISMDFAIRNKKNGKTLFGEIKRQDGWVESKEPSAGRGNAHERCCKYFTPGLQDILRQVSNLPDSILPFWIVFVGDITRDPKRNREIAFWFNGYTANYFMWRDINDIGALLDFFENNLLHNLL